MTRSTLELERAAGEPFAMDFYSSAIPTFTRMLRNLDRWIDLATEHASAKKFDVEILMTSRLAPDQFAFIQHIQSATDTAKFYAARASGKDAPSHPDTEKTLPEIRARLRAVIALLETFKPEDFAGTGERRMSANWMRGKTMTAQNYLHEYALANFYFHVTHAYAILRHNGVALGKLDFLGPVHLEG